MADILIRGMEMPKNCWECRVQCDVWDILSDEMDECFTRRHPRCPLLSLPEGHGRLIDGDLLLASCKDEKGGYLGFNAAIIGEALDGAQTVVPEEHVLHRVQ